ncbi:unnamed protein product [Arctia plantaginis]|uniref:Protein FAM98A n=1 Tax=Arctia plantaginis TaxID=874455 RepID=A0A8S0ZUP0_ARCPL|nr:unnamed protein product [Arctia plantaginis]
MENDIIDSLNDMGYVGPLTNEDTFLKAVECGAKSMEFTKLIHILADELKKFCRLEETVNVMNGPEDSSSFLLELSSFLKELGCPYKNLVTGHMSSRLQSKEDCLLLLDYLISELMAARMVNIDSEGKEKQGMEIVMQESPTAKNLKEILIILKFNKPPPNISPEMLFSKLEAKLKDTIAKEGDQLVGKPLYNKALSEKDWKQLETIYKEMYEDYRLRKETLITRLECTIQSFQWSERLKKDINLIQSAYRTKREMLKPKPDVKLSDFLAARTSLLHVEKTSSASVRQNTQSEVNKVIIGQVPDRGGRPHEQQPPPPEMPSWQQRSAGGGRGGGGGSGGSGRGGGGGFGGRGGYDSGRGTNDGGRGGYNSGRGGYDNNRGGYDNSRGGYDSGRGGYDSGRGGYDSGRGGYNSGRGGYDGGRGGYEGGRGGYDGGRGGQGGRGGRVQGGYSQASGYQTRPQTGPGGYTQNRNHQTFEVPFDAANRYCNGEGTRERDLADVPYKYMEQQNPNSYLRQQRQGGDQRKGFYFPAESTAERRQYEERERQGQGRGGGYRGGRR